MRTNRVKQLLQHHHQDGLYRARRCQINQPGRLNFTSNDYLALASDRDVQEAYQKAFRDYPCASAGSMFAGGYHEAHQRLESDFAQALAVDSCVLFASGYAANLALMALCKALDATLVLDKAAHASIYDGMGMSRVTYRRYPHQDLARLSSLLQQCSEETLVFTESVFSMSGHKSALTDVAGLCAQHETPLIIDEAHSFGLYGPNGLGGVAEAGLSQTQVPLRVIPFGKAMASTGAVVAGQKDWIELLLQGARPLIYSTAMSPAQAVGLLSAFECLQKAEAKRQELQRLVTSFQQRAKNSCLTWRESSTPIQQLQLGCAQKAVALSKRLREQGIDCTAIRQPTVPKAETGLRVTLNAQHTEADLEAFFDTVHALCQY